MPRDLHSHAEPERVRVRHLELDLTLDFDASRAHGSATLHLVRADPEAPLVLDSRGLEIAGVEGLAEDGTVVGTRPHTLGEERGDLGAALTVELAPGDAAVRIAYRTPPGAEALQWLAPAQTAGGRHPFLFSQGQAILTRTWIPLQDSPGVRVTFDARVRAPAGLTVVMAAESLGRDDDGAFRFRMPQAIPSYLIAIACGALEFRAISERTGVWAEPAVVEGARAELEDTEAMVAAAEGLFGAYRWGRFDLLVLPPSFPFGGMENPRLTFATPTILAGDKSLVSLVAHELAHSWSGNLVTNATWRDFWLNEGFTVYFEQRIMEEVYGSERSTMEQVLSRAALERQMAELEPFAQVLHIDLADRSPEDGFTLVPYDKGALFLRRIEELVGRTSFDRFLADWFDTHAFESVVTADLLAALEVTFPDLGARLDIAAWLEEPGLPADTPEVSSPVFDAVDAARADYLAGATLDPSGWTTHEWLHFIEGLPEDADAALLARLDGDFDLTASRNSEILCAWLLCAIRHGYAAADGRLEAFLGSVGRRKFVQPLYQALAKAPGGEARARELYGRLRPGYHAVTAVSVDRILDVAG